MVIEWAEWDKITVVYWYGNTKEPHRSLIRYAIANFGARLFRGRAEPLSYGVMWTPAGEDTQRHAEHMVRQVSALLAAPKY